MKPWVLHATVLLISLASLALEVLQMRIFAFALWHHLAFLVVSIAILGFAAGGACLASSRRLREAPAGRFLAVSGLLFALTALAGPFLLARQPIDVFAQFGVGEALRVGLYYVVFALPYVLAGAMISLALTREAHRAGRLYFFNLLGSGGGCFVIFAVLRPLGAGGTLFLVAALGGVAAVLSARGVIWRGVALVATAALVALIPGAERRLLIRPAGSKLLAQGLRQPNPMVVFSQWTPLCRIDVARSAVSPHLYIFQDGDAPTVLPGPGVRPSEFHSLAYRVLERPKVLVIGVGGGLDVEAAVDAGAREVTGVEINPVTLALASDPTMSDQAARFASLPQVRLVQAEGRTFVRRSRARYDLIQMTGVDTYTALASGAYVLSESYLYTVEAFHDYLGHLTTNGMLSITRFAFPAPRETLRIMVMACRALAARGAREPWRHVVVLRRALGRPASGRFETHTALGAILIRPRPFEAAELETLRRLAASLHMVRDFLPDEPGTFTARQLEELRALVHAAPAFRDYPIDPGGMNPFHAFARALREGREEAFLAAYPYNVRPVRDDAPFFFNQHRPAALVHWLTGGTRLVVPPGRVPWHAMSLLFQTRPLGLILLGLTLVQLSVLVALCIFGPLACHRRERVRGAPVALSMLYFLCLGLGYIFLMISAMQGFGLLLGHPTHAISITMATFLIASGLGSLVSGRFSLTAAGRVLGVVAAVVLGGVVLLHLGLAALTGAVLSWPFGLRVLVTVGLLAPMAFVMGMCFPTGIRLLGDRHRGLVPWAYGVNGAATVLGSVVAVCLALGAGFSLVRGLAAGLYVVAALTMTRLARS